MSLRFQRRKKIFPGVYLNLSKSGISASIGVRGAHVTVSKRGTFLNTGIPGTGLSQRVRLNSPAPAQTAPQSHSQASDNSHAEFLQSAGLDHVHAMLQEVEAERAQLRQEISRAGRLLAVARLIRFVALLSIIGMAIPWVWRNVRNRNAQIAELKSHLAECALPVEMELDAHLRGAYDEVVRTFAIAAGVNALWSVAAQARTRVAWSTGALPEIRFAGNVPVLGANGVALHLYPAFIVVASLQTIIGLQDWRTLKCSTTELRYAETESLSTDAAIVDKTWEKTNKDGSPDKRFNSNREIPVVAYRTLELSSEEGLHESWMFSSTVNSEAFVRAIAGYAAAMSAAQ